jgi:putative DNA primase/helicase
MPIQQFRNAMQAAGINPACHIIADGQRHRFHVEGRKAGSKDGAYFLHLDGNPTGWFMDWKTGISGKWSADGKSRPFTPAMRKQVEQERKQREFEKQLCHEQAAKTAVDIWSRALPAPADHPYLTRKKIKPHHTRIYQGKLTIPVYDESRVLVSLQFIYPDGTKRPLAAAKKKACFSAIRKDNNADVILIAEGFSTAASLHEASGHYVAIAFGKGNLLPTAQVIRKLYPKAEIIVCGDNDLDFGGQKSAIEAAAFVNGKYKIPPNVGQDWNDFLSNGGQN